MTSLSRLFPRLVLCVLCAVSSLVLFSAEASAQLRETPRTLDQPDPMVTDRDRVVTRDRVIERHDYHWSPGETYVAGFGGYTFGHQFNDVRSIDNGAVTPNNTPLGDRDLKNSGVYGAKLGYFLPDRWRWLGFEAEAFNTSPHIKQSGANEGTRLGVTTVAFNAIARGMLACRDRDRDHRRTHDGGYRDRDDDHHEFCPLQPYVGAGLGLFWARARDIDGRSADHAAPGLNLLAGLRYYVTEKVAVFGEYKYNHATFRFEDIEGAASGLKGGYSASHIVAGLSLHF